MNKSLIISIVAAVILATPSASARIHQAGRHEVRLGWGDQMFETLVWHQQFYPESLPTGQSLKYNADYRYTQHWFTSYQYNLKSWLSVGAMADFSGVKWTTCLAEGGKAQPGVLSKENFYNISILPTCYFTYMRSEYVALYSGLGLGLDINTGTEVDVKGRKTACAPVLYLNFFGVKAGYKNVFCTLELGGLVALEDMNMIYMLGSRMVSVGVGVSF